MAKPFAAAGNVWAASKRFTTYEFVEDILPMVVKKDGRRETFDRHENPQWSNEGL